MVVHKVNVHMQLSTYINVIFLVQALDVTNISINIFEGQSVSLVCIPKPISLQIIWTFNDNQLTSNPGKINLSPDGLYHQLIINQSSPSDSGMYVCHANTNVGKRILNTTTLIVTPGKMLMNFDYLYNLLHMYF